MLSIILIDILTDLDSIIFIIFLQAIGDLTVFHLIQLKKWDYFPDLNLYFLDPNKSDKFDLKNLYLVAKRDDSKTTTINLEEIFQKETIPAKAPISNIR